MHDTHRDRSRQAAARRATLDRRKARAAKHGHDVTRAGRKRTADTR